MSLDISCYATLGVGFYMGMDKEVTIEEIKNRIKEFNAVRNWDKYHRPKDLILALLEELGELSRIFKWVGSSNEIKYLQKPEVKEEIADLFIYLFILSHKAGIDISDEIFKKLEINGKKYPIERKFEKGGYNVKRKI